MRYHCRCLWASQKCWHLPSVCSRGILSCATSPNEVKLRPEIITLFFGRSTKKSLIKMSTPKMSTIQMSTIKMSTSKMSTSKMSTIKNNFLHVCKWGYRLWVSDSNKFIIWQTSKLKPFCNVCSMNQTWDSIIVNENNVHMLNLNVYYSDEILTGKWLARASSLNSSRLIVEWSRLKPHQRFYASDHRSFAVYLIKVKGVILGAKSWQSSTIRWQWNQTHSSSALASAVATSPYLVSKRQFSSKYFGFLCCL